MNLCPACFQEMRQAAPAIAVSTGLGGTEQIGVCVECFKRYINIGREATMRAVQKLPKGEAPPLKWAKAEDGPPRTD